MMKFFKRTLRYLLFKLRSLCTDRFYVKWMYYFHMGEKLNLDNPQTFTEKLQWLKLYNHDSNYTVLVDKVKVKDYIAHILGEDYLIPTIGVWEKADDIDFDKLPEQFVLKCNHNSGLGMCICKDKSKLDIQKARLILRKGLAQDYFLSSREWPYKNVPRRILGEKFMVDESGSELKDYKFYCFDGEPYMVMVASGRNKGDVRFDYLNMDWQKLPLVWDKPNSDAIYPKPVCFNEMKAICRKLAKGMPHVRIDLYIIDSKPYFGEFTFFDNSGYAEFDPKDWNLKLGKLIPLDLKVKK